MAEYYPNTNIKIAETKEEHEEIRYLFYTKILYYQRKSEFIDGQIVNLEPLELIELEITQNLFSVLSNYIKQNNLGFVGTDKLVIKMLESQNCYQPDICYFKNSKAATFNIDTSLFPPPDLVIEVLSPDSVLRDREQKFKDYAINGIEEYCMIDYETQIIEQYYLNENKEYLLNKKYSLSETLRFLTIENFEIELKEIFKSNSKF